MDYAGGATETWYENSGPTMLAQMRLPKEQKRATHDPQWDIFYDHCDAKIRSGLVWRFSFWAHWARLAEYWKPRRYKFLVTPNQMNKGSPINDAILDGTSIYALNTCASGMWSAFTNPEVPWIRLKPKDESFEVDRDARKWLDDIANWMLDVFDSSNFYTEMAQAFEDLPLFGTAPVIVYEDYEDIIRLYVPCAGEYFCWVGARQSVDSLGREYQQTVAQIVEFFGLEACPNDIQRLWREGGASQDREYVVRCIIEPNYELATKEGKTYRPVPAGFDYRETYWIRGIKGDHPLSLRGYHDKPFSVFRWAKESNDPYGRSPCMEALGDNKQVQWQQLRKGEYIEKLVRPPMGADPELKMEPQSILPGKTTYVNTAGGKKGFWPLFEPNPQGLVAITEDIKETNLRLERALFVDVFMAITQMQGVQPRNELELTKRDLERLNKLGPVVNLVSNALADIVVRVLDIGQRRKLLPPKPASLRNVPLKLEFETMMRRAQRAAAAVGMKGTIASLGEMSLIAKQSQVPDPIAKFDLRKAAERMAIDEGWPVDCIFYDQEVEKHDLARQKAVAAAQAPQQAMAAVAGAKALGQTPIGPGTALGALMGQGGQPGGGP